MTNEKELNELFSDILDIIESENYMQCDRMYQLLALNTKNIEKQTLEDFRSIRGGIKLIHEGVTSIKKQMGLEVYVTDEHYKNLPDRFLKE